MPTYKEVLKKLKAGKVKPKKTRPRAAKRPIRRARQHAKLVAGRKPVKKVVRRIVRKSRPRSGSRQRSGKPIRKKPIKRKPVKKIIRKSVNKKKTIKKPVKKKPKLKKKIVRKTRPKPKIRRRVKKPVKRKKIIKKPKPIKRKPRRKKSVKPRVYIGKGTLDQLFESQAKVKLLKFFFRNAEDMFQQKDIFKHLRTNAVLLRQEMKKLENAGLIKQKKIWLTFEKKRGGIRKDKRTVYYLNPAFEFFKELRELALKSTIASKDDLVVKAKKLGIIKLLALAGVFMGDSTARADLFIVGDKINYRKLNNFIKDLEAEIGKEINCAVMTSKEFNYRYDMYDRFVRDLLTDNCEILIKKVNLW